MNRRKCKNGHLYNCDKYDECPFCLSNKELMSIPEKYRMKGNISRLSTGAICRVYKIESTPPVVLKVFSCGYSQEIYKKALNEKHIVDMIGRCDRVIPVLDFDIIHSQCGRKTVYLLEKYYISLKQFFNSNDCNAEKTLNVAIDLCEAVQEVLNRGVFHLDLRPENIFLSDENKVLLGNFGSALLADDLVNNRSARGTLEYMAPEVYWEHRCSEQSEIYSIGLILFYLLNNQKLPFVQNMGDKAQRELAIYKRLAGTDLPLISFNSLPFDIDYNISTLSDINSLITNACTFKYAVRTKSISELKVSLIKASRQIENRKRPTLVIGESYSIKPQSVLWNRNRLTSPIEHLVNDYRYKKENGSTAGAVDAHNQFNRSVTTSQMDFFVNNNDNSTFYKEISVPRGDLAVGSFICRVCGSNVNTGATFCPYCGSKISIDNSTVQLSKVEFSAIAPKQLVKGEYSIIDIIMYEEVYRHLIDEIRRQSDIENQEKRSGKINVQKNAKIRIILQSSDIQIEDNEMTGVWQGSYLNFSFSIYLPDSYPKQQVLFVAKIFINGVIATRLTFIARCSSSSEQKINVNRQDVQTAFISYASEDRNKVLTIVQGMQKARPDMDLFIDVENLRSGEKWKEVLYREIEKRDTLFLCWSHYAKCSIWVDREWRYAYKQKGIDGIEPMPLEPPEKCPPPGELNEKHWNDRLLYLIDYSGKEFSKK